MTDINPYQSPTANVSDAREALAKGYPVAGKMRRFINFVIDMFCFYALMLFVGVFIVLVFGEDRLNALFDGVYGIAFSVACYFAYYTLLEGTFSFTIGKLLTGTRVVATVEGKSRYTQALMRTLCRHIPFEPFSLLASDENVAWHDSLAKTKVVFIR